MKCFSFTNFKVSSFFLTLAVATYINGCTDSSNGPLVPSSDEYTLVDFDPVWSAGSDMFAFVHSDLNNDYTGIYIMNSNGTGLTKLISDFARNPDWSPDNHWIVFAQFDNIYKINIAGDSTIQLTNSAGNSFPKWSYDNSLIAYSNCSDVIDCSIRIMKPDGTDISTIDINAKYPEWISGSNSLIYFKPDFLNGMQTGDTLTRYFLSDSSKQNIIYLGGEDHRINMSPVIAGDAIVFCSMNNSGSAYIYKMDFDGSNLVKLTSAQGFSPDYSYVNQKIVYTNRNKGNGRLWTMNKDGSNQVQLSY